MALEKIDSAVAQLITQLANLADKNVDKAVLTAGHILQAEAISNLITGVLALAVLIAMYWVVPAIWKLMAKIKDEENRFFSRVGLGIVSIIGALICLCSSINLLLDGATWISAFNPYAAVVAHFLKL